MPLSLLDKVPGSRMVPTDDKCMFNFFRNFLSVCLSGCTILRSQQHCVRIPPPPRYWELWHDPLQFLVILKEVQW